MVTRPEKQNECFILSLTKLWGSPEFFALFPFFDSVWINFFVFPMFWLSNGFSRCFKPSQQNSLGFFFVNLLQSKIFHLIFLNSKLEVCRNISNFPWSATKHPHLLLQEHRLWLFLNFREESIVELEVINNIVRDNRITYRSYSKTGQAFKLNQFITMALLKWLKKYWVLWRKKCSY